MNIKLEKLVNCFDAMTVLHNQQGMDVVTAYRIMKNWDTVSHEIKCFDKQNMALCEKYGEKDKDGKIIVKDGKCEILKECREKYLEELKSLLEENVDISIKTITLSSLYGVGLSPAQLATIDFMLEETDKI